MKKAIFSLVIILIFYSKVEARVGGVYGGWGNFNLFGKGISGAIRPYGGVGKTLVNMNESSISKLAYRGGFQGLWITGEQEAYIGVGIDLGYNHLYKITSPGLTRATYINTSVIAEISVVYVLFQIGLGPYFGVGDTSETEFGIMFSGGVNIPVDDYLSIPLLIRADIIYAHNTSVPISFFTGITYYFPGKQAND